MSNVTEKTTLQAHFLQDDGLFVLMDLQLIYTFIDISTGTEKQGHFKVGQNFGY